MEQLLLFSDDTVFSCRWDKCLRQGDLAEAREALRQQRKLYPDDAALVRKAEGLACLDTHLAGTAEESLDKLAELVRLPSFPEPLAGLHREPQAIREGLWALLWQRLVPGRTAPLANGLLPAEIAVRHGDWPTADTWIADSLRDLGEHAFLRQLQAVVAYQRNRRGEAWTFLLLALFHDATACRFAYLLPELVPAFREIRDQTASDAEAWTRLAFRAWREGMLPVPPDQTAYETFLSKTAKAKAPCPAEQAFLRHLYLAEAIRSRREPTDAQLACRKSMQSLKPDWFSEYMATIEA